MEPTRWGPVIGIAVVAALLAACQGPPREDRSRPTVSPDAATSAPATSDPATSAPPPPTGRVRSLLSGADDGRSRGPQVAVGSLPKSPHPVLASFGFKAVQTTRVEVESVEGAGGTWQEVYEPSREISGGVTIWVGEGLTGGPVTVTFSGPLEAGRLGWTFDAIPGLDPSDPFIQIEESEPTDAMHKEVTFAEPPSGPIYAFVLVGIGGGRGTVQPIDGAEVVSLGEGPVINVGSVWSEDPRDTIGASWTNLASNIVVGAELRTH